MKRSSSTSTNQISGQEDVQRKVEVMKITITDSTDRIIVAFSLRPWKFRSGAKGFWGSTKKIDWETQKYYQIQAYMIEIGSKVHNEMADEQPVVPIKP